MPSSARFAMDLASLARGESTVAGKAVMAFLFSPQLTESLLRSAGED